MGLPLRICSSPWRAMMSVPEAWQLPRIPETFPALQMASTSSDSKASPSVGK